MSMLGTATLRLITRAGITRPLRVLCDNGAQVNLITNACANRYGLKRWPIGLNVTGYDCGIGSRIKSMSEVEICSRFTEVPIRKIQLCIVPRLPNKLPGHVLESIESEDRYADPTWNKPGPVEMLIDSGVWAAIIRDGVVAPPNGMVRQNTMLGHVIFGSEVDRRHENTICAAVTESPDLTNVLNKLWESENVHEIKPMSAEDEWCQTNFLNTHSRTYNGRYSVKIPLKPANHDLGESRNRARLRFFMLESRLKKDPELAAKYVAFMREYESLGHMRPVQHGLYAGMIMYYIPHHPVVKKFRVVFDASAITSNGKSLNDVQFAGPKLQADLVETVINFRAGKYAFSADIIKMFRQVEISQDQWNLQRIFWRETPEAELKEYWLTVVTYGMASSAYNAVRALIQCAADHVNEHPEGAKIVNTCFYMDDMLACADSISEAKHAKEDVTALLEKGGFKLDKWVSNAQVLIDDDKHVQEKVLAPEDSPSVLGLKWDHRADHLMINLRHRPQPANMTKRQLASSCAALFDPLKLLSPVTIAAKCFLKNVWDLKIGWDEEIPDDLQQQWRAYYDELQCLAQLRVPRWIGMSKESRMELHIFTDASNIAYGAAAYIVARNGSDVQSNLIMSVSKLAPKTPITIPRLELSAAVAGVQLLNQLKTTTVCRDAEVYLWTDSEVVLHWLSKPISQLKVFVANRVTKILRHTAIKQWNHVKSALTVAWDVSN